MPDSILEKLDKGYQLIYEGRIQEALKLVDDLDKEEDLTQEGILRLAII